MRTTLKTVIAALLLTICQFCFTDSKRLQDNDFSRQFLFRGFHEPTKFYMNPDVGAYYLSKRVPSAADMMIRFGKRFASDDTPTSAADLYIA